MSGHYDYMQERIKGHCAACDFWDGYNCRKGHVTTSPTGCPIKKFKPVYSAGYDPDKPATPLVADAPAAKRECDCGKPPKNLWEALKKLRVAFRRWRFYGYPITGKDYLAKRKETCSACEFKKGLKCSACGCYLAVKSRMASELCPKGKWVLGWGVERGKEIRLAMQNRQLKRAGKPPVVKL